MADSTPPLTAERPAGPLVYRPLSGLAIAGLMCSAAYAALVVISLAFGLVLRAPFFLAGGLLALPVAGVALSLLARQHIRNSEGTRAGEGLVKWGLWLGLLSGLGYGSYTFFTGLAVRSQADRFLMEKGPDSGYLVHLLEGDTTSLNRAFLLTKPPTGRRGSTPTNEQEMAKQHDRPLNERDIRGHLSFFHDSDLVRLLRQRYDTPITVERGGVRDWGYENKAYYVERFYRIITPEAMYEVPITVRSIDSDEPGEGRKWYVEWRPGTDLPPPHLSALGEKMKALRHSAANFAYGWLRQIQDQKPLDAFLATHLPAERPALRQREAALRSRFGHVIAASSVGQAAAGALPGNPATVLPIRFTNREAADLVLPGFGAFTHGQSCLSTAHLRFDDPKIEGAVREALAMLWLDPPEYRRMMVPPKLGERDVFLSTWEIKDGRLRIAFPLDFAVSLGPGGPKAPRALVTARLIVDADASVTPGRPETHQAWRLVALDCLRASPMPTASGPGGPGGP